MQTSPVNGVDRSLGCPLVGACSGAMLRCGPKVLSPVSRFISNAVAVAAVVAVLDP